MTRGTQGGRYREGPGRSASSERQFGCATWNSVTKKGVFWLPMRFADSSVTKKAVFWLPMRFAECSVTKKGGFWLRMGCGDAWWRAIPLALKMARCPTGKMPDQVGHDGNDGRA